MKHSETRFLTQAGAMRQAKYLARKVLPTTDLNLEVFIDRVGFRKPYTGDREEMTTNRIEYMKVDIRGRIWVWSGRSWVHTTSIRVY